MRRLAFGLLAFLAWAPLDARAGSIYTPPAGGGSSTAAEVVPSYVAIEAESAFVLADWDDAADFGGAYSVDAELGGGGLILSMPLTRKADGTGITGVRSQARLASIAAGDFVVGFALAYQAGVEFASAQGYVINCGAVFVDGTDVSTSDWFGALVEWSGTSVATGGTLYSEQNEAGVGNQFTTYTGFAAVASAMQAGQTSFDIWLRRSGTTLTAYYARPGAIPTLIQTWTVTAGAGLAGPRCQINVASAEDVVSLQVLRYRYIASAAPPWIL